ncbi:MAG: DNA polymerase III subunit gamma/tau [Alistipes senegalensis]|nr:DNA polymerase III subunit gamma/tau [Oxalobacter formigenes]MCM1280646.1 DNA polymerase III subunit gamma/tau [Alistipes senegalensis]
MSYLVLARKYRPKTFDSLVGQDHVVRALTHALKSNRLHHAYLFTGTRGVGKTTLSRLLAKALNCETGITPVPCGTCEACRAIDADRFVDYVEMDAASNRGIADMLQLLEQAVYAPTNARFKVYMIDEVHMLTAPAFNAMLKTLEEPPEYIKFILATTDPQKIPVTVLSRCLQFNLKQMPVPQIVDYLDQVLKEEEVAVENPALRLLAEGAGGSMRDALSLTDQAIAYTAGNISLEAVRNMLGVLDQTYLIRILEGLAARDGEALMAVADEMASRSLSYSSALRELGLFLHRIALAQTAPAALPDDLPEREAVLRFAGQFGAEDVQLFYQIAVHGKNELDIAPDEYAGFTMTLLRMLAFCPDEGRRDSKGVLPAVPEKTGRPAAAPAAKKVPVREAAPADIPPLAGREEAAASPAAPLVRQADAMPSGTAVWDGDWPSLAESLPLRGMAQQLAQQTELVEGKQEGGKWHFHLRSPLEALLAPTHVEKLTQALENRLGCAVKITSEVGAAEMTASRYAREKQAARQREAEEKIQGNACVQALMHEFGARIVPHSIKPV